VQDGGEISIFTTALIAKLVTNAPSARRIIESRATRLMNSLHDGQIRHPFRSCPSADASIRAGARASFPPAHIGGIS